MAVQTLLALPSAARATYSSGPLTLPNYNGLVVDLDVSVTALTGGTSPTVTFKVSRVEPDGVLYQVYQPTALSAAGVFSQSIGPGEQTAVDLGSQVQIDMVLTGAPTSITFSLTMQARGF
jgi:hypothetical protein